MTWMVFRAPGPEKIHGHMVEFKVIDEAAREEHLADGWFDTAVEAGEAQAKKQAEDAARVAEEADDKAAATREEAIEQLEKLGVTFDRRLGLSKLLKLIDDELEKRKQQPVGDDTDADTGKG